MSASAAELVSRIRLLRNKANQTRRAAVWSDHDAYGCAARGLLRQARGLESQADRLRADADDLDAAADALESAIPVSRPVRDYSESAL